MLNHVNKIITVIVLVAIISCNQEKKNKGTDNKILEISTLTVGGRQAYERIRQQVLDSLNAWCKVKLASYESVCYSRTYKLDSLLCFNSERDRMVSAILIQCNEPICETDAVHYLYGAQIKGKWYFFRGGGAMIVLREHYQSDIHAPVSFEKLHELAANHMLRSYIKKKSGIWQINDAFFSAHFEDGGWGDFNRQLPKDTMPNGEHFTDKKAFFENIYLRGMGYVK